MEVISEKWSNLVDNEPESLSITCYISQIFVYPASYQSYQFWKRRLNDLGNVLVCQDCVILDPSGNQARLTIHPSIGILSKLEASYVEITSVMKSTQCGKQVCKFNVDLHQFVSCCNLGPSDLSLERCSDVSVELQEGDQAGGIRGSEQASV